MAAYLFEAHDQKSYMVMQNKEDLVELLLSTVSELFKFDQKLPNYTVRLLCGLVDRPKFLALLVHEINFFHIMCYEMQRFDCGAQDYFALEDWVVAIARVLEYGEQTKG